MAPNTASKAAAASIPILLLLWAFLLPAPSVQGQNLLGRHLSLDLTNVRLDRALGQMEEKGHFYFAYREGIFRPDSTVSLICHDRSVKWALDELFDRKMNYRVVGNHIVLVPAPQHKPKAEKMPWVLQGYLVNSRSGKPVPGATLYEPSLQASLLSGENGEFSILVDPAALEWQLAVRKNGYRDTVVVLRAKKDLAITIGMEPEIPQVMAITPQTVGPLMRSEPVESLPLVEIFIPEKQKKLALNVQVPIGKIPVQVSLVPGVSTNRLLSGGLENHFSLNILGGYAYSVRGAEIGTGLNILRDGMTGFQAVGGLNVVGADVRGFQAAGGINRVSGNVSGFQAAGGLNIVKGNMLGFQAAGGINRVGLDFTGFQAAGGINRVKGKCEGFQAAGIVNYTDSSFRGFQAAGVLNMHGGDFVGFSAAGVANELRGTGRGVMVAGVQNHSPGTYKGLQIAGLVNRAHLMKGLQIGVINIADTLQGAAIGLINISKRGHRALEVAWTPETPINFAVKSGTHGLYNIYAGGWNPASDGHVMAGLGLGSRLWGRRHVNVAFESVSYWVFRNGGSLREANFLYTFNPSLGVRLGQMELFAGPTANLWVTQTDMVGGGYYEIAQPRTNWTYDNGITYLGGWIGFKGGLRLVNRVGEPKEKPEKPEKAEKKR